MPLRASWSSASFLLYAGGIVILLSTGALLSTLGGEYGDAAFAGWSMLVFVALGDLAFGARFASRPRTAGLFAFSAVVASGVVVGALEEWAGWLAVTLRKPACAMTLQFAQNALNAGLRRGGS